jgi:polyisoprenoid-binding protein YceI
MGGPMKKIVRIGITVVLGMILGGGGILGLQARGPRPSPPDVLRPASAPPPSAPRASFEFFGLPSATAEEARPSVAAETDPLRRYVPIQGSSVAGFDATSTLHDFRGWTRGVSGEIRFDPGRLEETAAAEIVVDARGLDTGDKDRDKDMHEHLQSRGYPTFTLKLIRFVRTDPSRREGPFILHADLEIRGTSVPVEAPGTFELRPDGHLHVKGEFRVRMSQFGITPPVTALVIRVADEVKVWFELWAKPERKER